MGAAHGKCDFVVNAVVDFVVRALGRLCCPQGSESLIWVASILSEASYFKDYFSLFLFLWIFQSIYLLRPRSNIPPQGSPLWILQLTTFSFQNSYTQCLTSNCSLMVSCTLIRSSQLMYEFLGDSMWVLFFCLFVSLFFMSPTMFAIILSICHSIIYIHLYHFINSSQLGYLPQQGEITPSHLKNTNIIFFLGLCILVIGF